VRVGQDLSGDLCPGARSETPAPLGGGSQNRPPTGPAKTDIANRTKSQGVSVVEPPPPEVEPEVVMLTVVV
jgi:hypothetical protein